MPELKNEWASGQMVFYPGKRGPGKEWFVDSNTGSDTNTGKDWENAKATANAAVDITGVAAGDTIWLAPNHAETLNAASALDIDVAGVQVVGVTRGRQMPTFTITHVDAAILLAGIGCTLANVRILGGVDAIVSTIKVEAVADCSIINCEYRDVTGQATDSILTTNNADRLLIDGYRHIGAAAAGANSAIAPVGCDDLIVRNFDIYGNFAVGGIDFRTTLSARVHVHDGYIWTANAADIGIVDTVTSSTGAIGPNINIMLADNAANITESVTGATFHMFDPVMVCNLVDEVSIEHNRTASTHA